jgi:hypothetical protein
MSDQIERLADAWLRSEDAKTARTRAGVSIEQARVWEEGWRVGRAEAYDVLAALVETLGGEVRVPASALGDPPELTVSTDALADVVIFRTRRG